MHEITEPSSCAFPHFILTAARLPEISDRRQLPIYGLPVEPPIVDVIYGLLCILLIPELHVHIPDQMISKVVAYVHLLNLTVFIFKLQKHIFEKVVVMLLRLDIPHDTHGCRERGDSLLTRDCFVLRVLIHILQEDGLREGRFVVET